MSKLLKADIAVIGAGSGGLSVAAGAAMLGLKVILFEKGEMGGDCLNYGCVPSKALISAARAAQAMRESDRFGVKSTEPDISWEGVKAHVRKAIDTIAPVDSQERFEGMGVTVIREAARFYDRETVGSDNVKVKARRIVVATGSRAVAPPIPGLSETNYLTNEEIFDLPELPQHLVIMGGGPIGVELGQCFRRLGAEVTLVDMATIMSRSEPDHVEHVRTALKAEGVNLLEKSRVGAVRSSTVGGVEIEVTREGEESSQTLSGSHLLVAVGRAPVLDGLDLEAGGVKYDRHGIQVRANLRSKSNPKVWAVGDAAGQGQFTHLAGWHASVFVRNALFKSPAKAAAMPLPAVTYCEPELGQIGLTESQARKEFGDKVKTVEFHFDENDRAIAEGDTVGGVKLVVGKGDKILGASVLGAGAGDILQIIGFAASNGQTVKALTNFISPYPTRAEVVKRAGSKYYQPLVFGNSAKRLVGLLQRIP